MPMLFRGTRSARRAARARLVAVPHHDLDPVLLDDVRAIATMLASERPVRARLMALRAAWRCGSDAGAVRARLAQLADR